MKKVSITLTDCVHEKARQRMKDLSINWDEYIQFVIDLDCVENLYDENKAEDDARKATEDLIKKEELLDEEREAK